MSVNYTENRVLAQVVADILNVGKKQLTIKKKYQVSEKSERFYHSQTPCKKCGLTKRYAISKKCVYCAIERRKLENKEEKEKSSIL